MVKDKLAFSPDYAVPPGETLRETIEVLGMTQIELSRRTGRPEKTISEIVNGKAAIIPETALQFERVLGIPARVWLNLEANYQATKGKLDCKKQLEREVKRVKDFPYAQMAGLGWVPKTQNPIERAEHLLSFLGVASFQILDRQPAAAYRVAQCKEPSGCALAVWLRWGQLAAQEIEVDPFDRGKLKQAVPFFLEMTRQLPEEFHQRLVSLCASCGVALVIMPHLERTYAHGATQWLTPDKALVQLTLRGKWADIFWFSFFHELGHLLLHGKRPEIFVNFVKKDKSLPSNDKEAEVDQFAADTLIPPKDFEQIRSMGHYTTGRIRAIADKLGIAPGIIVGRLQHEGYLEHNRLNGLRVRFTWTEE